jgi:hypothetical protein
MVKSSNRTKLQIKNKEQQKRYIVDQAIVAAVAVSPASALYRDFGLIFFMLGFLFFSAVSSDTGGYLILGLPGDFNYLSMILDHIDETGSDVSPDLLPFQQMLTSDLALFTLRHDVFATEYPALIGGYEEIMRLMACALEQIQLHANTGPMDIQLDQMVGWEPVVTSLDDASDILRRLINTITQR